MNAIWRTADDVRDLLLGFITASRSSEIPDFRVLLMHLDPYIPYAPYIVETQGLASMESRDR
jgi:hypothetical protein